jgi:hypothetical protein
MLMPRFYYPGFQWVSASAGIAHVGRFMGDY